MQKGTGLLRALAMTDGGKQDKKEFRKRAFASISEKYGVLQSKQPNKNDFSKTGVDTRFRLWYIYQALFYAILRDISAVVKNKR